MAKIVGYLNLHLPLQSVLITTNVVSVIPTCGSVYLKQIYTIKFVSYLRQVLGFLWVLASVFNKTDRHNIAEKLFKVTLKICKH